MDMKFISELGNVPFEISVLASNLNNYKSPSQKIIELEKQGTIIRLKKGMYVVSPDVSGKSLSEELIANHLYGPSYVSMETALRYYGLIPERVHTVASMTLRLTKNYENRVGRFEYMHCPANYYSIGIRQVVEENYAYLIASPEKALCDLITYTPKLRLRFVKAMQTYLEEDIRFDMDQFYKMDTDIFEQCLAVSKKKVNIQNILKLLKQ